jgi:uncharacterized protein
MAKIQSIYRYPVKGLTPEPLARAVLTPGQTIPGDRLYAIENGPSGFDPAAPSYLSKTHFLMLMKNERLANLHASFDQDSHTLTIALPSPDRSGDATVSGDLRTAAGRTKIEAFFADYCAGELRGPPKILHANGHSFSDVARKVVSIINLASVAAVEDMVGKPVHPLRFRGNLYVEGWPRVENRRHAAESRQAYRPLRRDQCRSRHRSARPRYSADAAAQSRPCRLRGLCRGDRRRRDRRGR